MAYQVKLSRTGPWHRRGDEGRAAGDPHRTACGEPIAGAYLSRESDLAGHLCPRCFTPRETETGEMKRIEKEALEGARADAVVEAWSDPDDDRTPTDIEPVVFAPKEGS